MHMGFQSWSENFALKQQDLRIKVLGCLIPHPLMLGSKISGKPDHQDKSVDQILTPT